MKKRFKAFGVRVLESPSGDLLINHMNLKHDVLIKAEELEDSYNNMRDAYKLTSKIYRYFKKLTELRWRHVKMRLIEIAKTDKEFVKRQKEFVNEGTIGALKILEANIYFYELESNPMKKLNKLKS